MAISMIALCGVAIGQGPRPSDLGASKLDLGEPGIAWYTTWESGLAEAKRSGRPIMFVAAATQCHGVSGVFWPGYTATQNGLFASKEFIDASREFVCVRIDSYESEAHQKQVRSFLNGRFENSVFCILAPDGKEWLSNAARGPQMVLGRRSSTEQMAQYAFWFPAVADADEAIVQDFYTFRQALNVASADQRILILVHAPPERENDLRESLRAVANDQGIVGRFHFDFDQNSEWKQSVEGDSGEHGIVLINPGEFGMTGKVMKHLPLDTGNADIISALAEANQQFAETTEKKVYSKHVAKGHSEGIYFEGAVPYGEDRDGDGQIDGKGRGRSQRGGRHDRR
jgi:hypothetical protein